MFSGCRRLTNVCSTNLVRPHFQARLHQQHGGRQHPERHHTVPVGHRGASRTTNQRHPVGLWQRRRRRPLGRSVSYGKVDWRLGSAVSSICSHQGACTGQEFYRKTRPNLFGAFRRLLSVFLGWGVYPPPTTKALFPNFSLFPSLPHSPFLIPSPLPLPVVLPSPPLHSPPARSGPIETS